MAPDFETWEVLALSETEVFLTQRKIPKVLIIIEELKSAEGTNYSGQFVPT